jgi:capsular exopolysaccharide synthesis family protein
MSAYHVAQDKENEIRSEIDNQKSEVLGLNDAAVQYTMLQREVDTNRELTNNVLQKMKDVGFEAEDQTSNISIVDRAEASPIPSSPNKLKDLMQATVVALAAGLALAVLLEYMNNTLVNPEEAAKYLRLANLGVVPEFESLSRTAYLPRLRSRSNPNLPPPRNFASTQVALSRDSFSLSTEAYRSIRTGIILSRAGSPPKVTMITSAMGGEGKTVTAVNTAVMFAQLGQKVLLIDADLRRPRCHTYLGLDDFAGLTDVLVGSCEPMDVVRATSFEGLSLISAGKTPPNCAELLGSIRMREALALFCSRYDCVIMDSPPLIPVSDGLLLATMVDGVVLVIDSSHTPKKQIRLARVRLEQAHAKIFGFVLNKMHSRSYYYHHYHRGYYAGYQREVG